jgi:hypothetical protein
MSVVYEPVEDCVRDGGFADRLVPVVHGNLAGRHCGSVSVPVVENLQ